MVWLQSACRVQHTISEVTLHLTQVHSTSAERLAHVKHEGVSVVEEPASLQLASDRCLHSGLLKCCTLPQLGICMLIS